MADPTPYQIAYSFSGFQATNPSTPLPAPQVDNELANIQTSVNQAIAALTDVRREDGVLNNGIVTIDSLAADVLASIGGGAVLSADAAALSALAAAASEDAAEAAQAAAASSAASAAMYAAKLSGTSVTSVAIATGSKSFVTQADKFFDVGNFLLLVSAANAANYMYGQVTTYSGTGLTVNVTATGGSGTLADWVITLSGARGATGATGSPGAGTGDMLAANNLSDVANKATGRTNMGVGSGDNVTFNTLLLNASANQIVLDADATNKLTMTMATLTAPRTVTWPDKSGTPAMTSDYAAADTALQNTIMGDVADLMEGCRLYQTAGTSVPSETWTALTFDTESYDDGGWHSTSSNKERVVVDFTGVVAVHGRYDSNSTSVRFVGARLRKNGTVFATENTRRSDDTVFDTVKCSAYDEINVVPGDIIDFQGFQTTGGAVLSVTGIGGTVLTVRRVK